VENVVATDKTKAENATLYAYEILRRQIIDHELTHDFPWPLRAARRGPRKRLRASSEGCKINQVEFSQAIGVSRTPVAKALSRLETEGLVDNLANQGFVVHETTLRELLEFYTVRAALETIIVNDAIGKATPQQLDELENLFVPYTVNWNPQIIKEYWLADRRFHSAIAAICRIS
jgi:DNA-binding GntR family transcriptional regulator